MPALSTPAMRSILFGSTAPGESIPPLALTGDGALIGMAGIEFGGYQFTASGGVPPYTYAVIEGDLPEGLALDPDTGEITGTPEEDGTFAGIVVQVTDSHGTTAAAEAIALTIYEALIVSGTGALTGMVGAAFDGYQFTASGGASPYTYTVVEGDLPAGLTLDPDTGEITGTPSEDGTFSGIVVQATDSLGHTAAAEAVALTIAAALAVSGDGALAGTVGEAFDGYQFTASGGFPPYTYAIIEGDLPEGLALDPDTGEITGTPEEDGTFSGIVIEATDSLGNTATAEAVTLTIAEPVVISGSPVVSAVLGEDYDGFTVSATGGRSPYTYSIADGALPLGVLLNSATGEVSGLPIEEGEFADITIRVTDADGRTDDLTFDLTVGTTVLLLHFEGEDGATETEDSSGRGNTPTLSDDAEIDTDEFAFGEASLALDGTGDVAVATDTDDWAFGGAPFTVEGMFRWTANPEAAQFLIAQWPGASDRSFVLYYSGTNGQLVFQRSGDGTNATAITATFTPELDTWYHIAVDFDGAKTRIYVDGTMVGSSTTLVTLYNSTAPLTIGNWTPGNAGFNGHVDEVRVTKGIARYGSDAGFTAPAEAFPDPVIVSELVDDPLWDDVVLLTGFDGRHDDTFIYDRSSRAHPISIAEDNGSARIAAWYRFGTERTDAKFGSAFATYGSSSGRWVVPKHEDFHLAGTSFTIEGWVKRRSSTGSLQPMVGRFESTGDQRSWAVVRNGTQLGFAYSNDGVSVTQLDGDATETLSSTAWKHFAVCYDVDTQTLRQFVNGVLVRKDTDVDLSNLYDSSADLGLSLSGCYLDEVRITRAARYVSDEGFTPPSEQFPWPYVSRDIYFDNVSLLCHFDGADEATSATDSSRYGHALTFNGAAALDADMKRWGSASLRCDEIGAHVYAADHASLRLGSGSWTIELWYARASTSNQMHRIIHKHGSSGQYSWSLQPSSNLASGIDFRWSPDGTTINTISNVIPYVAAGEGQWIHICIEYDADADVLRSYCDGVPCVKIENAGISLYDNTEPVRIGRAAGTDFGPGEGWVDEVRITKGVARYKTDTFFVPPGGPFPDS